MTHRDQASREEQTHAADVGVSVGRKMSDVLSEATFLMTVAAAKRRGLSSDSDSDQEDAMSIASVLGVTLRINALTQILSPLVADLAGEHERRGLGCLDECAKGMLSTLLLGAIEVAIEQGKVMHEASKREANRAAADVMMADPDVGSSDAAKEAERKLAELMASLGKGR